MYVLSHPQGGTLWGTRRTKDRPGFDRLTGFLRLWAELSAPVPELPRESRDYPGLRVARAT